MSDDLPSLDKLQQNIDELKSRTGHEKQESGEAPAPQGLGQAMRYGVELLSGIIVGCVAGFYLDRWLKTGPLFLMIGFSLGAVAGFRNLLRAAREGTQGNDNTTDRT